MGGKNPAIVTATADLDNAAEGVARAAFGLAGQKCSACSRAIVMGDVHDAFVERLAARTARLPLGDPADRASFVGPVVNAASLARFQDAVADARRDGSWPPARTTRSPGHFVEPTVVCDLPLGHPLERDELFLPFVTVTGSPRSTRRWPRPTPRPTASRRACSARTRPSSIASSTRSRPASSTSTAGRRHHRRVAGEQSFCGWKSSGSTGKGGLGPYYLAQFMREQSRTVVG